RPYWGGNERASLRLRRGDCVIRLAALRVRPFFPAQRSQGRRLIAPGPAGPDRVPPCSALRRPLPAAHCARRADGSWRRRIPRKRFPDYGLSSAIKVEYKTRTSDCFCGFERWHGTKSSFKEASVRLSLQLVTERRISAGRR